MDLFLSFQFHDLRWVLQRVTAALAGIARCALQAERKREPSDFVISPERSERLQRLNEGCGETGVLRDGFHGHAVGFHLTGGLA